MTLAVDLNEVGLRESQEGVDHPPRECFADFFVVWIGVKIEMETKKALCSAQLSLSGLRHDTDSHQHQTSDTMNDPHDFGSFDSAVGWGELIRLFKCRPGLMQPLHARLDVIARKLRKATESFCHLQWLVCSTKPSGC